MLQNPQSEYPSSSTLSRSSASGVPADTHGDTYVQTQLTQSLEHTDTILGIHGIVCLNLIPEKQVSVQQPLQRGKPKLTLFLSEAGSPPLPPVPPATSPMYSSEEGGIESNAIRMLRPACSSSLTLAQAAPILLVRVVAQLVRSGGGRL